MRYKISELVSKTGVSKSTILYYIREGLLPEAVKLKANVHRYSDEHLEMIKYIKYMKQEMGSSNEQIKNALEKKNQSFLSSYSMLAPLMQTLSGITPQMDHYTQKELLDMYGFNEDLINKLLQDEIVSPIKSDDFTQKDVGVISLVLLFEELGLEYEILKKYVTYAKELAALEQELQEKLCSVRDEDNFSMLWKVMFETLFNTKEYIFKRHTHKRMLHMLKKELKEKH